MSTTTTTAENTSPATRNGEGVWWFSAGRKEDDMRGLIVLAITLFTLPAFAENILPAPHEAVPPIASEAAAETSWLKSHVRANVVIEGQMYREEFETSTLDSTGTPLIEKEKLELNSFAPSVGVQARYPVKGIELSAVAGASYISGQGNLDGSDGQDEYNHTGLTYWAGAGAFYKLAQASLLYYGESYGLDMEDYSGQLSVEKDRESTGWALILETKQFKYDIRFGGSYFRASGEAESEVHIDLSELGLQPSTQKDEYDVSHSRLLLGAELYPVKVGNVGLGPRLTYSIDWMEEGDHSVDSTTLAVAALAKWKAVRAGVEWQRNNIVSHEEAVDVGSSWTVDFFVAVVYGLEPGLSL